LIKHRSKWIRLSLLYEARSFRIPQNITGDFFDLFTLSDNMIVKIVLPNEINADST
jgi:hypothetical protein